MRKGRAETRQDAAASEAQAAAALSKMLNGSLAGYSEASTPLDHGDSYESHMTHVANEAN